MLHKTTQNRPEWIGKAAKAAAALFVAHKAQESVKAHVQASEAALKTDLHEVEEKIADIIHRHFAEHK